MNLRPGDSVGRWRLIRPLGRGSFGAAWRAEDATGRIAAIKLLDGPPGGEVLALARICHPSIPAVLDAQGAPQPYLAMSLARGRPLSSMIRAGRAPETAAMTVAGVLADALSAVHGAGIVHGDVKPDNVVVGSVRLGEVWLVDFGMVGMAGGTLHYAAPERLGGGPPSAAADVYALGLMLWEMLFGALPWAEEGISVSLSRRRGEAPRPEGLSDWLGELLQRILDPDPEHRPSAGAIADVLAAHGVALPQPGPALIRRRARAGHVPRAAVESAGQRWLQEGGCLAIIGRPGSGRSHALRHLITSIQAEGGAWVRLVPSGQPWAAIRAVLTDPSLPGSPEVLHDIADADERAEQAARQLEERSPSGLAVIVDDFSAQDEGTQRVLAALARRGAVSICTAGEEAPPWADQTAELTPLDRAGVTALVDQVLGEGAPLQALAELIYIASGGQARAAVDLLAVACKEGVILRRARRWLVDRDALLALAGRQNLGSLIAPEAGTPESVLGGLIASARVPLERASLAALADLDERVISDSLDRLVELGLVRQEHGRVCCAGLPAQSALLEQCDRLQQLNRRLAEDLLTRGTTDDPCLGWYVVRAEDAQTAAQLGPNLVVACGRLDPVDASRLADALWALTPTPLLAAARIDALRVADRNAEALAFGVEITSSGVLGEADGPALVALGRAQIAEDDILAAKRTAARARTRPGVEALSLDLFLIELKVLNKEEALEEAVALVRQVSDLPPPTAPLALDRWLELKGICAQVLHRVDALDEALELLEDVPPELGEGRAARALLLGMHGRLLWHAGRFREAARVLEGAGQTGTGLAARDRAKMLNNAGLVFYQTGARLEALARWEECLLLFERMGDELDRIRVSNNLCVGYREVARWERARQAGEWAAETAAQQEQPALEAMAAGNMGDLYLEQGALEEADRWFSRAEQLAEAHALTGELVELARRRATLAVRRGEPIAVLLARRGQELASAAGARTELSRCRALEALCLARQGQPEATEELLQQAMGDLRADGAAGELAMLRLLAAESWLELGWTHKAQAECERVSAYAREQGLVLLADQAGVLLEQIAAREAPAEGSRRLEVLLSLAARLTKEDDLLEAIAEAAQELLGGDRAFVLLGEDEDVQIVARCGEQGGAPSQSVVQRVLSGRREVIAADLSERGDLREAVSVVAMDLRSAMCVPMLGRDTVLGAIYVDSRHASEQQLSASASMMRALAAYGAIAVQGQQQVKASDQEARRAAEIVHDLRAPVGAMVTVARELAAGRSDIGGVAAEIIGLGQRAMSLAEGLLGGAGATSPHLDLATIVEETCQQMGPLARQSGVLLRCEAQHGLLLPGAAESVRRVLSNIIGNALRYGRGPIYITLLARDGGAALSVRDHGDGIPEDILPRIFERGVRTGGAGSHGLGTAITRRLVDELGGRISAANHPEGGALFTVWLPAHEARAAG